MRDACTTVTALGGTGPTYVVDGTRKACSVVQWARSSGPEAAFRPSVCVYCRCSCARKSQVSRVFTSLYVVQSFLKRVVRCYQQAHTVRLTKRRALQRT